MWYFTADLHLDHDNIIKHCHRTFKNVQEMNEHLIEQYAKTVKNGDNVVIAGDLTMYHKRDFVEWKWISRMPGNKIFLTGNHDYWMQKKRHLYHKKLNLSMGESQYLAISHYPMRSWKNSVHGSWNLHGHSHGMLPPFQNQLDIGVDNAKKLLGEYRPFNFDEVKHFIENNPAHYPYELLYEDKWAIRAEYATKEQANDAIKDEVL